LQPIDIFKQRDFMRVVTDREFAVVQPQSALPPLDANQKSVAILLATYNGARFLVDQLNSIERQTHTNWRVFASDDGSSDGTRAILAAYRERWGAERLRISHGPQRGHAANFLSLVQDAAISADYYAFCDQDDVWLEDKLERSVRSIEGVGEQKAALYGSSTIYIDPKGHRIGSSKIFKYPPSIENAFVQNIAGGNTMLLNGLARKLLRSIPLDHSFVAHDWTTYLLVIACNGLVIYDPLPSVNYRQHEFNLHGSNVGLKERVTRIVQLFRGQFRIYSASHLHVLNTVASELGPTAIKRVNQFQAVRDGSLFKRIASFWSGRFHRQTRLGNLGMWFAVLSNRI
jgi:glycosyltransferase involved in cell wall biosynthesis